LQHGGVPDFLLLGDSHARMWVAGLDELAREHHLHGVAMAYSSCVPLKGAAPPTRAECTRITDTALAYAAASPIRHVILAGYWVDAAETAFSTSRISQSMARGPFEESLLRTIEYLARAGKVITVVLDVPELQDDNVPYRQTLRSLRMYGAPVYGVSGEQHIARQASVLEVVTKLQRELGFAVVDPAATLCQSGQCLVARDGRSWYRDKHHLTDYGSRASRNSFLSAIQPKQVTSR